MADSYVTQTGDGTEGPFSFSALDYLSVDHLVIKVDGTEKTLTTHYTISGTDVTFTSGNFPAADAVIKIQRDTPRTKATRVVDFADGAVLTEADLDNAHLQNLYIAQESFETSGAVLIYDDSLAAYTADSKEIKVLADPTTDASAVNRKYVTDVASFGVPGVPQQFNTTITDASTQFTLTDWDGVSQNMIVVALDGVVQIPGTDFSVAADGTDTVLTLVGITPPNPTILNVQNFGVAKSSSTLSANSVTTATIVDTAVTTAKLGDDSVTTGKLADDAVTQAKIADDAVDFARLKDTDFIPGTLANAQPLMIATDGDLSYRNLVVADVTDFNSTLNARAISGFGAATGNVIMGDGSTNYKITNLDAPTSAMDAARKAYVDGKIVAACAVIHGPSKTCSTSYANLNLPAFQTEYDPDGVISVSTTDDRVTLTTGVWRMDGHLCLEPADSVDCTFYYKVIEHGGGAATWVPETIVTVEEIGGLGGPVGRQESVHFSAVIDATSAVEVKVQVKSSSGAAITRVEADGSCITFQRIV